MLKRTLILLTLLLFPLVAVSCASAGSEPVAEAERLLVTDGTMEKTYTAADLEALAAEEATFQEVTYRGVPLAQLLADAGFEPQSLRAVRAVATDGFSASYERALFNQPDTLVAYSRADGPLTEDDGAFRMVLPNQEGRLNVRYLATIEVIP